MNLKTLPFMTTIVLFILSINLSFAQKPIVLENSVPEVVLKQSDFTLMEWDKPIFKLLFTPNAKQIVTISEYQLPPEPTVFGVWDIQKQKLLYEQGVVLPQLLEYSGEPATSFTKEDTQLITEWVDDGQTLLLAMTGKQNRAEAIRLRQSKLQVVHLPSGKSWEVQTKDGNEIVVSQFSFHLKSKKLIDIKGQILEFDADFIQANVLKSELVEIRPPVNKVKISPDGEKLFLFHFDQYTEDRVEEKIEFKHRGRRSEILVSVYQFPEMILLRDLNLRRFYLSNAFDKESEQSLSVNFQLLASKILNVTLSHSFHVYWDFEEDRLLSRYTTSTTSPRSYYDLTKSFYLPNSQLYVLNYGVLNISNSQLISIHSIKYMKIQREISIRDWELIDIALSKKASLIAGNFKRIPTTQERSDQQLSKIKEKFAHLEQIRLEMMAKMQNKFPLPKSPEPQKKEVIQEPTTIKFGVLDLKKYLQ
ncbi:Hypothetical protein PBC10988_11510 [Planctomycetales bacterium 10988]|nr:Hypothetical protein PBC10988_11510 [Planctomycetales bacterium 10988]